MTKKIDLPYSMLIYDIETSLLLAWTFALGDQVVRHNQLLEAYDMFGILTISYKWYGEKEVYVLEGENALEEFDKIARQADVIIGKNNFRFDDKRLNTERLIKGLPPFPEFLARSDDLESQIRKYFTFPSFSLDALSKYFGEGGKDKMDFSDWVDIAKLKLLETFSLKTNVSTANKWAFCKTLFKESDVDIKRKGQQALSKMKKYNMKDVRDTEALLTKVLPYIKLKKNAATQNDGKGCSTCGYDRIVPTKVITAGMTKYQEFYCPKHEGYGGRATFKYDKHRHKIFGRIQ